MAGLLREKILAAKARCSGIACVAYVINKRTFFVTRGGAEVSCYAGVGLRTARKLDHQTH